MRLLIFIFLSLSSFALPKVQVIDASFMSSSENRVIVLLNEVRKNPVGFEKSIVAPKLKKNPKNSYLKSLSATLKKMKPVGSLVANKTQYESAKCHALEIGSKGLQTHKRQSKNCKKKSAFNGECIAFASKKAEDILLMLLVDEGVPSLGHRIICLDDRYKEIGVSIEYHKKWKHVAVLDFGL